MFKFVNARWCAVGVLWVEYVRAICLFDFHKGTWMRKVFADKDIVGRIIALQ